mmetsp:Transcript_114187/g.198500  ORF Transcript_114187/g.198500 Transcript_114187/m.198500 type:complete len:347 (+) Transcript_114187:653-1693(+)
MHKGHENIEDDGETNATKSESPQKAEAYANEEEAWILALHALELEAEHWQLRDVEDWQDHSKEDHNWWAAGKPFSQHRVLQDHVRTACLVPLHQGEGHEEECTGRCGQTNEIHCLPWVDVELGQTQRGCNWEEDPNILDPGNVRPVTDTRTLQDHVAQSARSQAERAHVCERVQLCTQGGVGMQAAGRHAIEPIKHSPDGDQHCGVAEVSAECEDQGHEAARHIQTGDTVGDDPDNEGLLRGLDGPGLLLFLGRPRLRELPRHVRDALANASGQHPFQRLPRVDAVADVLDALTDEMRLVVKGTGGHVPPQHFLRAVEQGLVLGEVCGLVSVGDQLPTEVPGELCH